MAQVNTAQLAELIGATDNAAFQQQVNAAVAELERQLKYPLCGTAEAQERIFNYRPGYLWLKTHPFYELSSVVLVRDQKEETVELADLQTGQNGELYGDWFNGIKLCDQCKFDIVRCPHYSNCDYVKVTAKWGFCAPTEVEESPGESPGEPDYYCCLPADLYDVLVDAVTAANDSKSDIQSESVGTRSYTKFAKAFQSTWDKYASVINFYAMRPPRV